MQFSHSEPLLLVLVMVESLAQIQVPRCELYHKQAVKNNVTKAELLKSECKLNVVGLEWRKTEHRRELGGFCNSPIKRYQGAEGQRKRIIK